MEVSATRMRARLVVVSLNDRVSAGSLKIGEKEMVDALDGSIFRMLRQGQRVVFDLDDTGRATRLRLGSEVDMETPGA